MWKYINLIQVKYTFLMMKRLENTFGIVINDTPLADFVRVLLAGLRDLMEKLHDTAFTNRGRCR